MSEKWNAEEYYAKINAKLKNRAFQDISAEDQARLVRSRLNEWDRRVSDVDLLYADALALGGWDFLEAFLNNDMNNDFFITMVKALRKREARHDAKLIKAILTTGAIAQGGKKTGQMINRVDKQLNEEAK